MRTANPTARPQHPHNGAPVTPEASIAQYEIARELDVELQLRDGVSLLLDIYRPQRAGARFPALVALSPYTRQMQRESVPWASNEAGIVEFWVPRGYAQVIVDVRGTNGSGGDWALMGPIEQEDYVEVIEWVAAQPWCNGRVGMVGCSYFGMAQNLAAAHDPPSLRAIFPYDAQTDIYRTRFFPGGIPNAFANFWFTQVVLLNRASGRNPNLAGIQRQIDTVLERREPFDGPFYRERSAWPVLHKARAPAYFGSDWTFYRGHLPGVFDGWRRTGATIKRMLVGPKPTPNRPFAAYHQEALRWYDAFLKDLDSGVLEGDPIQLWIPGEERWRGEREWPLARMSHQAWFLDGDGEQGTLADTPGPDGEALLDYDPAAEDWLSGLPRLVFRSEPLEQPIEVTGPVELKLAMSSTAEDTDWIVSLRDEAPDGSSRELTKAMLRSSHRALDAAQSLPAEPWHPHESATPLTPGEPEELAIGLGVTCNVFAPGHRLRLEISNCESSAALVEQARVLRTPAGNTVLTGRAQTRLMVPVVGS
jgi:hypothetical protein